MTGTFSWFKLSQVNVPLCGCVCMVQGEPPSTYSAPSLARGQPSHYNMLQKPSIFLADARILQLKEVDCNRTGCYGDE